MRTATKEWLTAAKDDLETVVEIIDNPRLTHVVAFHAQQCIEKGFKAVLEEHEQEVPNIHNLITLHGRVSGYLPDEESIDVDLLERLNQLYIDARYPGERGLMPEGKPSEEEGRRFQAFAEDVLDTIRQHLREQR
jgi:HEPN domain-containing protein